MRRLNTLLQTLPAFVLILLQVLHPPVLNALSDSDRRAIYGNWPQYVAQTCGTGAGGNIPNSGENEKVAFFFFVSKGLSNEQAAGIVGNMVAESGVNPHRVQNTKTPAGDRDTPPSGSIGYGIVQWTPGTKILPDAEDKGAKPGDFEFQLNLVWDQLQGNSHIPEKTAGDDLKQQTTVEGAATSFLQKFERAASSDPTQRIKFAKGILYRYGGQVPNNSTTTATCGGGTGGGEIIDGFVLYNQNDGRWDGKAYGTSTIGESGCGPSSLAMIVATWVDKSVTPETIATKYGQYYIPGSGSSWDLMVKVPEDYGLHSASIGTDMKAAISAIQEGGLVVATGTGPKPFTSGGHILVIRGVTNEGKLLLGDPGHKDTSKNEYDPGQLSGSIKNMWVITK